MHSSFVLTFVGLVVATGGAATAGEHSGAAIAAAAATTAAVEISNDQYVFFCFEKKVVVQSQKFAILAEFSLNLSPVRRRCNEIRYPRGFSY